MSNPRNPNERFKVRRLGRLGLEVDFGNGLSKRYAAGSRGYYDYLPGWNATTVKSAWRMLEQNNEYSPDDFYQYITGQGGAERSDALDFGVALHMCVLEPDRFKTHVFAPESKGGKRTDELYRSAERCGGVVLTFAEYQSVLDMAAVLRQTRLPKSPANLPIFDSSVSHAEFAPMFDALKGFETIGDVLTVAQRELFREWVMPDGEPAKAQLDIRLETEYAVLVMDVKSSRDASRTSFTRDIDAYGLDIQMAHYREGEQAHTDKPVFAILLPQQKSNGFTAAFVPLPDIKLQEGLWKRSKALAEVQRRFESGAWESYDGFVPKLWLNPEFVAETQAQEESFDDLDLSGGGLFS